MSFAISNDVYGGQFSDKYMTMNLNEKQSGACGVLTADYVTD